MNTLSDLVWWQNMQQAAMARYKASRDPGERLALLEIADTTSAMVVTVARKLQLEQVAADQSAEAVAS